MTRDAFDPHDGEITTAAEFEATLHDLLLAAISNDINPRGAWEYRNGERAPDLEVQITELAKPDASD